MEMVFIPSGEFLMGSTEKDGKVGQAIGIDELPQHSVNIQGFHMDLHEVTNRQYKEFVDAADHRPPGGKYPGPYSWEAGSPPSGKEDIPVTDVSWHDADAYCLWAGKRLPAEAEWEKAARGTDGRQWPWGNEPNLPSRVRANTQEAGVGWTMPVGSYPEGVSPYGVYDMAGNVMEWTSSWYQPYPGSTLKRESFGEKYKILKGGAWENSAVPITRSAYRHPVAPKW